MTKTPDRASQQNLNQGATAGFRAVQIPTHQIPELTFHHLSLPPLTAEANSECGPLNFY